jgi:hypothetical protein
MHIDQGTKAQVCNPSPTRGMRERVWGRHLRDETCTHTLEGALATPPCTHHSKHTLSPTHAPTHIDRRCGARDGQTTQGTDPSYQVLTWEPTRRVGAAVTPLEAFRN